VQTTTMLDASGTNSVKAVQYYNGLGYPTVAVSTVGTNGQTAATLTTYDALGREDRKYVPVPGNNLDILTTNDFKNKSMYYQDASGFTQNHYDALDRVIAVDIAGDKWRKAGKQNRTEYLANTSTDKVLHYEAPEDGSYKLVAPDKTSYQYYPAGSLSKVISYDADNKSVTVFTDLFGNKILERTAAGDTYYVYNVLGQLRFVLPPALKNNLDSLAIFAYEYRYDKRGRIDTKILPQGGTTLYYYDKADRVAYMRDPALGNKYRFFLYDKLGRLCVQGSCTGRTVADSKLAQVSYDISAGNDICGTGYTAPYSIPTPKLEIVNYYDNYDFIGKNFKTVMPTSSTVSPTDNQKQYAIGSQTGSVVYTNSGDALGSINLYDQKGQVVRSVRKGLGGFVEDVNTGYTFTGAIDSTTADVTVKYGNHFIAKTNYTYGYGKKTKMALSVSHGNKALTRKTEYSYDFIGRLSNKARQLSSTYKSYCSYYYDIHGWITTISSGGFREDLCYADGLEDSCYNGNISTIKWNLNDDGLYQSYNLKYDDCNRLKSAVYGMDSYLYGKFTGNKNYFNEFVEYDSNGNIIKLQRGGLVDKMHGGFGYVDNLVMSYNGNQLTSVCDNAIHDAYNGATDFYTDAKGKKYALTYNASGSLVSDASRKIAKIEYDNFNNPIRIQFTNGNVTKYIYSATGEKLRVIYQTAVYNLNVAVGSAKELTSSQIQSTETVDYLLGGALTLRNGRIDKYQFEEGYCQAEKDYYNSSRDYFTFCYYDQDHLGNIRQVTEDDGSKKGEVIQTMNYYPFGAEFCDNSTKNYTQKHKYNGKEFDNMHGLNSYDYGARQYNPVTARWDRIDPLCEKYYSVSPYAYCLNNPVRFIDPDGKEVNQPQGGETLKKIGTWGMIGGALMMASATVYMVVTEGGGAALGGAQMFSAGSATFKAGLSTYTAGVAVDAARESVSRPDPIDSSNSTINAGKKKTDHGKNEAHGDGGRKLKSPSTQAQLRELDAQIKEAPNKKVRRQLEIKRRHIIQNGEDKEKGENHSQSKKR
ncbi:MAG: RHS repeat-associated core domain-containing protein, partial [Prevotellaceae bacterium]|nr:RHS repeat-associated core domain-containing protein [Prevotellaceae bacterium]